MHVLGLLKLAESKGGSTTGTNNAIFNNGNKAVHILTMSSGAPSDSTKGLGATVQNKKLLIHGVKWAIPCQATEKMGHSNRQKPDRQKQGYIWHRGVNSGEHKA